MQENQSSFSNICAWRLFSELKKGEYSIFSPFNISVALSIVHLCAGGLTESQLSDLFGGKYSREELTLVQSAMSNESNVKFATNFLLNGKVSSTLNQEKLSQLQDIANITIEDFSQPKAIVKKVNDMISDMTNGLIKDTIQRVDPRAILMIVNIIYFKANWKFKFDPSKTDTQASFYSQIDGKSRTVSMMQMKALHKIPYFENDNIQMIELPYATMTEDSMKGNSFAMGVILPKNRADRFSATDEIESYISLLRVTDDVKVKLPKFKLRQRIDLIPILRNLGVNDLFSQSTCNLDALSGECFVSDIVHEAIIIVDENGTEAAAVTAVQVARKRKVGEKEYKEFEADHSFLYYIRHLPTNFMVFLGEFHGLQK